MNNNKMKFNDKSDNRNNRTYDFDVKKADRDNDGKVSSYEATVARLLQVYEQTKRAITKKNQKTQKLE